MKGVDSFDRALDCPHVGPDHLFIKAELKGQGHRSVNVVVAVLASGW